LDLTMATRALILPFTCTDTSLPMQDMSPPPPPITLLPGSSREWRASELTVGGVLAPWVDLRGGASLINAGGSVQPTIVAESGVKHVHFDGVDDIVPDATFSGAQPHTRVIRFRWHTLPVAGRTVLGSTGTGTAGNTFGIVSAANNYTINAGTPLVAAPTIAPSTAWKTAIVVFNGATSILSIDGVETAGAAGANTGGGLRISAGSGTTPTTFAAIDVRAVAIIPRAADSTERAAILSQLSTV
jgi:hypothetical protein